MGRKLYLQKEKRIDKLSKNEQQEMVYDLINALTQAKSISDAALFLQDLLTKTEMKTLAKRLRIAKLLLKGMTYEQIEKNIHASHGTIAKIAIWLSERGEGFRKVVKSLPKHPQEKSIQDYSDWDKFKRQYSLYFWPELLLGEIVKGANNKQKERIKNVLEQLDEKSELHRKLEKFLYSKV